ncbi:leukotriene B4 receptor 1-like [Engraulis encrasicolus]|uniref:leukotriene B4 receptor 1-like n=1 Tax=Engraulis encrasicolus TaxID=184585 RepID=UPI002FD1E2C5
MEQNTTSHLTEVPLKNQIGSGVLAFCFLIGIPGNIFVVVAILRHCSRPSFTFRLMLTLAASDVLCLLYAPLAIYNLLWGWHIGDVLCKAGYFFVYLSIFVSLLTVTLISVHRYVFVLHAERWGRLGRRGERMLLAGLWAAACLPCAALMPTFGVIREGSMEICWRLPLSDGSRVAVLLSELVMNFIFPFSTIATCYCCLHRKVNQTAFFSDQRMTRLVTSIVVTFLILWMPCHAVTLLEMVALCIKPHHLALYDKLMAVQKMSRPVVKSLTFVNSCANPLLYAFQVRSLRSAA